MIFGIENLGPIEKAEVDLNKDLILLCGHNNTGKSYLAYGIYHLLTMNNEFALTEDSLTNIKFYSYRIEEQIKHEINEIQWVDNRFSIHLLDIFKTCLSQTNLFDQVGHFYKDSLKHFFAFPHDVSFSSTQVKIELSNEDIEEKILSNQVETTLVCTPEEILLSISKTENSPYLHFTRAQCEKNPERLRLCLVSEIFSLILGSLFSFRAYIAPAERSAINIFSKELSLIKNKLLTQVLKPNRYSNELFDLLSSRVDRYPKPLRDNLEMAEDLVILSKRESEFGYLADELEQQILKGKILVLPEGDMKYVPDNAPEQSLEIYLTASLVKSLANFVFYLRFLAKAGDYIIIDEPELNLHPDNQVLMARFLGQLVNAGFKVITSTHSDYIIMEMNNLIMLSKPDEQVLKLIEKYGYGENQLLKPEQVGAYLFQNNCKMSKEIEVSETGLDIKTIDDVVKVVNESSRDIYFTLFD